MNDGATPFISVLKNDGSGFISFRATDEALARWRKSALNFTNRVRKELGMEPLDALRPGAIQESRRCTLNQSITAEGLFAEVDYSNVRILDVNNPEDYDEDDDGYHSHVVKVVPVPSMTQRFLKAFDAGLYPDLRDDSLSQVYEF